MITTTTMGTGLGWAALHELPGGLNCWQGSRGLRSTRAVGCRRAGREFCGGCRRTHARQALAAKVTNTACTETLARSLSGVCCWRMGAWACKLPEFYIYLSVCRQAHAPVRRVFVYQLVYNERCG